MLSHNYTKIIQMLICRSVLTFALTKNNGINAQTPETEEAAQTFKQER